MPLENFISRKITIATPNFSSVHLPPEISYLLSYGHSFIFPPSSFFDNSLTVDTGNLSGSIRKFYRNLLLQFNFRRSNSSTLPPFYFPKPDYIPVVNEELKSRVLVNFRKQIMSRAASQLIQPQSNSFSSYCQNILKLFLAKHEIIFKLADKNLGLVLLDRSVYIRECLKHLQDPSTYKELFFVNVEQQDLFLANLKRQTLQLLELTCSSGYASDLPSAFKNYVLDGIENCTNTFALFYVLPKIHKGPPLRTRPIASNVHCITQCVSRALHIILQPIMVACPSYVKNSMDCIELLEQIVLPNDTPTTFVMFDVENLYPSIPISLALQMLFTYLHRKKNLFNYSHDQIDEILKLLEFVLLNNFVQFGERFFKQIQGTAMGTSVAVCFACIFMAALEETWHLITFKTDILFYRRFIDDGLLLLQADQAKALQIIAAFNALDSHIKITFEISNTQATFLDFTAYRSDNSVFVRHYAKPFNTFRYIPFDSYHQRSILKGFIVSELTRYCKLCTEKSFFLEIRALFKQRLCNRGYLLSYLDPIFASIQHEQREQFFAPAAPKLKTTPAIITWRCPFIDALNLNKIISSYWPPAGDATSEVGIWLLSLPRPHLAQHLPRNLGALITNSDILHHHDVDPELRRRSQP